MSESERLQHGLEALKSLLWEHEKHLNRRAASLVADAKAEMALAYKEAKDRETFERLVGVNG